MGIIINMKLELLIGNCASGKSTYCDFARDSHSEPVVLSSDEARFLIAGNENNQECSGRAFDFMRLAVEMLLRQNKNVIVDATNITRKARKDWVRLGRKYGALIQMTVFNIPVDVCKARNAQRARKVPEAVIDRMAAQFQMPTLDECDEILVIEG
jgi:protein phosphatase